MSVPTASSLKKMNVMGRMKSFASNYKDNTLGMIHENNKNTMTKAQKELLGYGASSHHNRNSSNGNINRRQILETILNDDELINHLQKMNFFSPTTSADENDMLWLSGNSNHDYRQQSKHQRREELGHPVRSSFVSNSNSNSNSNNKGNINNHNHVVRSVNRGGTYFNSDDDKSGGINDLSQKIERRNASSCSPVSIHMQQGVPQLSRNADNRTCRKSAGDEIARGSSRGEGYRDRDDGISLSRHRNRRGR